MQTYLIRRTLTFIVTVWFAATLSFFALLIVPGNPARIILGFDANPAALAALESRLGLDLPPVARYWQWMADLTRFDLGTSLIYDVPGTQLITERLQVTLPLTALATIIALVVGVPLGLWAARMRGRPIDLAISMFAQLGLATPSFWLGMFLIVLFAVRWQWLPAGGFTPWTTDPVAALGALLLPAVALGTARGAALLRIVRSAALDVLSADYVRTARAKGASEGRITRRHVFRNTLLPLSTVLALEIGQLLAGAIIIETVFSLPGIGALALGAVSNRDLPLVQAIVLCMATATLALSLVSDLLYVYIDPRVRYG